MTKHGVTPQPKAMPRHAAASAQWGSGGGTFPPPKAAASASTVRPIPTVKPILNITHTFAAESAQLPNHKPIGHQIPMPKALKRWKGRDETRPNYVDNHKKMLWRGLKEELKSYAAAIKGGIRDPHLGRMQKKLFLKYSKLWDMDHFCLISLDAKPTGEPARWINMNQAQIDRNEQLLKVTWDEIGKPDLWRERLTELRQNEQREAMALAASARGGYRGDDTSDEELPMLDIADDDIGGCIRMF